MSMMILNNLTGFISKNGSENIPVIRCGDNEKCQRYLFCLVRSIIKKFHDESFRWENL